MVRALLLGLHLAAANTLFALTASTAWADDPDANSFSPDDVAFFESRIRPVLIQHCYECHSSGATTIEADLRLDTRTASRKGGLAGKAIVPGSPDDSLVLKAIRYTDGDLKMPPSGKLPDHVIADFEQWIRTGAADPRGDTVDPAADKFRRNRDEADSRWSFQRPIDPPLPSVSNVAWPTNGIDHFILSKLEAAGLHPLGDASKTTLIRRVTYDLIGLPPTPEEIDAFLADSRPEAFEAVVDRLLASPQYGERWGRHWLDVVRYADTAGDNSDFPIPQMYRYRNWVIDAINRDLPYDEFIRQQLAGDLLPGDSTADRRQKLIATGYIANARRFGSRVDDYPQHLTIEDTLDNLGRAYLGLSLNCARCHDHKFDPISTEDYYGLYGFFDSTRYPWPGIELEQKQRDLVPLVSQDEVDAILAQRKRRQDELDAEVERVEKARDAKSNEGPEKEEREALDAQVKVLRNVAESHAKLPLPFEQAYAVVDSTKVGNAAVQLKGNPEQTGAEVPRRFPIALGGFVLSADDRGSGRLQLANWIASADNPLTARVMMNRLWAGHFGRGLVATPNDFGKQGRPPTHPELLDWLSHRFVENNWSMKAMHRLMVMSRTYRLACVDDPGSIPGDPNNDLLSGFRRRRLDAESLRDTLLVLGGNLDPTMGGPHPFPPQTEWKFTQHNPFKAVYPTNRRSVYLMTQRIQRHPYLAIFDGPDTSASTAVRSVSTSSLQALYLFNNEFVHRQAEVFADRVLAERKDDATRLDHVFRLALGRSPDADEASEMLAWVKARTAKHESRGDGSKAGQEAWRSLVRVLFRLNEFVYID
jgi:hypothetical protein